MKKTGKPLNSANIKRERRKILVVDGDDSYSELLRGAWSQLMIDDDLQIVCSHEEALSFLHDSAAGNLAAPVVAVVLDPDSTGEETGAFLRETRKYNSGKSIPIVFWTRDGQKYDVLEGRGADSVVLKPKVLRVIQELDQECGLSVRPFSPFIPRIQNNSIQPGE